MNIDIFKKVEYKNLTILVLPEPDIPYNEIEVDLSTDVLNIVEKKPDQLCYIDIFDDIEYLDSTGFFKTIEGAVEQAKNIIDNFILK